MSLRVSRAADEAGDRTRCSGPRERGRVQPPPELPGVGNVTRPAPQGVGSCPTVQYVIAGTCNDVVIRTAAGGTLFLDEVGDLPLDVQPKLLRFLQKGEIQPLGEQRPSKVDVRIIAATNTDLEVMVSQGRFREDLYYRLNVIGLRVPPLRERRSEIPTIVNYYVNHYSAKFGRKDIQITPQAVDLLMVSDWPGNVRQLCNEIQRTVARATSPFALSRTTACTWISRVSVIGGRSTIDSATGTTAAVSA